MANKDNKTIIIGIIIGIIILIILGTYSGYGMMRMMGGYGSVFLPFGWIFSVLLIILLIVGIYWLVKKMKYN